MRRFLLGLCLALLINGSVVAAIQFPVLTGRVVDNAHILSDGTRQNLEQTLATHEAETTNQVVVVTLPSLDGQTIEDYGFQLGRHWQIGQKDKNNGVILLVAPKERKVRIEVGYGLEPVLTDAICSEIIQGIILPKFRSGDMEQGIIDGTNAIIATLNGKPVDNSDSKFQGVLNNLSSSPSNIEAGNTVGDKIGFFVIIVVFCILFIRSLMFPTFLIGNAARFGSIGGGFGGGFSGGGGSFGGGGASGGW